jgi:hypothetical protein
VRFDVRLVVGAATDVGRVREGNEDGYLVDEPMGLVAIADGMGGHRAGEVASATALSTLGASRRTPRAVLAALACIVALTSAAQADTILSLYQTLRPQVESQKLTDVYETIDRPLIRVLARMEEIGIRAREHGQQPDTGDGHLHQAGVGSPCRRPDP